MKHLNADVSTLIPIIHSHLIRVEGIGYLQIIQAEKADVCRSCDLGFQVATIRLDLHCQ